MPSILMTNLIGRTTELALVDELLDKAEKAAGGAIAFAGSAGMGKSLLLRNARDRATRRGFEVRHVTGTPSEASLPYAALHALLTLDDRSELPESLSTAIGLRATDTAPFVIAVAAALVQYLSARAEQAPLLLVVDDMQWIDPSSAAVLSLAAGRLLADQVAMIFAIRTSAARRPLTTDLSEREQTKEAELAIDLDQLAGLGMPTYELKPLTHSESTAMLHELGVSPSQCTVLAQRSQGVPLVLTEGELNSQHDSDGDELLEDLQREYLRRVRKLSKEAQQLCHIASIDEGLDVAQSILSTMYTVAVDAAVGAGILEVDEDRVRFTHPLVRAAIERARSIDDTRATHALVAAALATSSQPDRYALHRAAATQGPDDEVAALLFGFAERARTRGALFEAHRATLRGAELTSNEMERCKRQLEAAELLYFSGDAAGGAAIARQVRATTQVPEIILNAELVAAKASEWTDNASSTVRELARVAAQFESTNPAHAIAALCQASAMAFLAGSLTLGVEHGRNAITLAESTGDEFNKVVASAHLAWNLFLSGQTDEATRNMATIEPLLLGLVDHSESLDALLVAQRLSIQAVIVGDWALADRLTAVSIGRSRRLGFRLSAVLFGGIRGALRWRTGHFEEGLSLTTDELIERNLPPLSFGWASAAAAQIAAALGRVEETERHVNNALRIAVALDVPLVKAWAIAARAHLSLSMGDAAKAAADLDLVADLTDKLSLREPGFFLWHGDYLEALVACGRLEDASRVLAELRRLAATTGRKWAAGVVARTEGVLGSGPESDAKFAAAVEIFENLKAPFEVARTNLAWGNANDSQGVRVRVAKEAFQSMGTLLWVERAAVRRQRRDESEGDSPASTSIFALLSAAESRVALAIGSGKTNREIAEELHVSVRTVEFHLGSIYRKTNIKNRSALIAYLR